MELNIGVVWRKCFARQLPNSHSGWDTFQARAVFKKCPLSGSTCWIWEKVKWRSEKPFIVYVDGNDLLVWLRYLSGRERFAKSATFQVRYVEFEESYNVQWNSILACVDGFALLVSFQTFILVKIPSRRERLQKVSPVRFDTLNLRKVSDVQWKLNLGVCWRKCSARQLPNSYSGWDPFQARAVCKKRRLSGSIRWIWEKLVSFSEIQYLCT